MSDDDLPVLRAPATGRRSDDAFARAVVDDVRARRRPFSVAWLSVPALAGAAAVAFVVVGGGGEPMPTTTPSALAAISTETLQALADDDDTIDADVDVDALDTATLLALADTDDADDTGGADDGAFAIAGLDGSTDRELLDVEAALDRALKL